MTSRHEACSARKADGDGREGLLYKGTRVETYPEEHT